MTVKNRLQIWIFGARILEAYFLDDTLALLRYNAAQFNQHTNNNVEQFNRILSHLLTEGMVVQKATGYEITSKGILHLNKGGYKFEIRRFFFTSFIFWLSIVSSILSVTSLIVALSR